MIEETYTAQRTIGLGYTTQDQIRQGYTGYQKDDESGLDFAQARYYNSTHGRFTSVDPLTASATTRNPQTFNRYSYALNSPYKFTDPLGLIYCGGSCDSFGSEARQRANTGREEDSAYCGAYGERCRVDPDNDPDDYADVDITATPVEQVEDEIPVTDENGNPVTDENGMEITKKTLQVKHLIQLQLTGRDGAEVPTYTSQFSDRGFGFPIPESDVPNGFYIFVETDNVTNSDEPYKVKVDIRGMTTTIHFNTEIYGNSVTISRPNPIEVSYDRASLNVNIDSASNDSFIRSNVSPSKPPPDKNTGVTTIGGVQKR